MTTLRDKASAGVRIPAPQPGPPGKDAYELALTRGYFSGTFEDWLKWLKGERGDDGLDAYQVAVAAGFAGTREQWLASLKAKDGDRGPRGLKGNQGLIGPMPRHEWRGTELRFEIAPNQWGQFVDLQGEPGKPGRTIVVGGGGGGSANVNGYFPQGW